MSVETLPRESDDDPRGQYKYCFECGKSLEEYIVTVKDYVLVEIKKLYWVCPEYLTSNWRGHALYFVKNLPASYKYDPVTGKKLQ